jgi:hypothetical protein
MGTAFLCLLTVRTECLETRSSEIMKLSQLHPPYRISIETGGRAGRFLSSPPVSEELRALSASLLSETFDGHPEAWTLAFLRDTKQGGCGAIWNLPSPQAIDCFCL